MKVLNRVFFCLESLRYELLMICRNYQDLFYPCLLLLVAITLFPLGVSSDPVLLQKIAVGIFWVIVLFVVALMLEQLFRGDWQDGDLEQQMLMPDNLLLSLFTKLVAFCLMLNFPLILGIPFLCLALYLPMKVLKIFVISLLLGTPTLVFLGGIVRALTLGLRHSGLLVVLLVLPFYTPVLIFSSSAVTLANIGLAPNAALAWLGVLMLLSVCLSPFVIKGIFRLGIAFSS